MCVIIDPIWKLEDKDVREAVAIDQASPSEARRS